MTTTHLKCYAKLSYGMSVITYYKRLFVMNYNIGFQFVLICADPDPHQAISTKDKKVIQT